MEIQRPSRSAHGRLAYIALAAGFIAMLSTFYYMQFLSYSVGVVRGITSIITTYNITPSNTLLTSLEGTSALAIAVHITYVMLPFTLIMFSIGAMLLITRQNLKTLSVGMLFSSLIFGMLLALMDADFYIGPIITLAPFIGVALGIYVGIKGITIASRLQEAHSLRSISIDPETPYSNMLLLSKDFFARLKGDISILDMHFDSKAMENMLALFNDSASNVKNVRILSGPERLGAHFDRGYTDFEEEMKNKGITIELRVMSASDTQQQHERFIMDENNAYKIPPINIINKKSEHIVSIRRNDAYKRFELVWKRSTKYENYNKGNAQK